MLHHLLLIVVIVEVVLASDMRMPPDIVVGPAPEILYRSTTHVRLECISTGQPKPRFDWKKNGVILDPNNPKIRWVEPSISGTIEIVQAERPDMGYYQCLAINNYGTAMSNVSFVQLAELSSFTPLPNPHPYFVSEGDAHVLPCEQLKCIPSATYSWALALSMADDKPVPLVVNERVQIDSYGYLHFSFIKKEDEQDKKLYKCHIFNPFTDVAQGGSYASISVTTVNPIPTKIPSVSFSTVSPVIGLINGTVQIECLFYGNPVPKVTWKKLNGILPPIPRWSTDPKTYDTEAIIKNLVPEDAGEYICTGTNSVGSANTTIKLIIEAVPTFPPSANHLDSKNVTQGESITFTCNTSAIPPASVTWYRDSVVLDKASLPPKYRLSTDGLSLTISDLCKNCSGGGSDLTVIQCNASNVHDYAFAQGFVNVILRTVIHEVSTSPAWEPGVPVTFSCRATSDDITPVTHTWFHNDQQLVYDSNVMFDPIQQVLHITTANDEDQGLGRAGTYRCQVTNGYSQATLEHFLTAPSVESASSDLWWILILILVLILLILLIILAYCCYKRNKGDIYYVDKVERKTGNDPEKDLLVDAFQDYQRSEKEAGGKKSVSGSTDALQQISSGSTDRLERLASDSSLPSSGEVRNQSYI